MSYGISNIEKKAEDFKLEVLGLCTAYNMFISHEDDQGAFRIENGENLTPHQRNIYRNWFMEAALV